MTDSFHSSGSSSLFQIAIISLWIAPRIVLPPDSISLQNNIRIEIIWLLVAILYSFSYQMLRFQHFELSGSGQTFDFYSVIHYVFYDHKKTITILLQNILKIFRASRILHTLLIYNHILCCSSLKPIKTNKSLIPFL